MTRHRVWALLEPAHAGDRASRALDLFLICLIITNVLAVVLGSDPGIEDRFGTELAWFEFFSVGIFTVEYLARLWSCKSHPDFALKGGRLRFALRPLSVIDLLAILPAYLAFLGFDARIVRIFRLFRLLRILKLARYSRALRLMGAVFAKRREELMLTSLFLLFLLLVSATLMYHAEHEAQPQHFASIPATLWWAVVTLTTVGYGDVYPITTVGRIFAGAIAIVGIGMVALPAGIISSGFVEEIEAEKQRAKRAGRCPHCGEPL